MTVISPASLGSALRQWFRPPRAHGEVIEDRLVSPLELFYDLVFVVLGLLAIQWAGVRRHPGPSSRAMWLYAHLPLALATAAVGAGPHRREPSPMIS